MNSILYATASTYRTIGPLRQRGLTAFARVAYRRLEGYTLSTPERADEARQIDKITQLLKIPSSQWDREELYHWDHFTAIVRTCTTRIIDTAVYTASSIQK